MALTTHIQKICIGIFHTQGSADINLPYLHTNMLWHASIIYVNETRQWVKVIQTIIVAMCWTKVESGFCQYQASSAALATKRNENKASERGVRVSTIDQLTTWNHYNRDLGDICPRTHILPCLYREGYMHKHTHTYTLHTHKHPRSPYKHKSSPPP